MRRMNLTFSDAEFEQVVRLAETHEVSIPKLIKQLLNKSMMENKTNERTEYPEEQGCGHDCTGSQHS